jgi:sugar phosphate permease
VSYRWVILAVGVLAQAAAAALLQGLPALAPQLRSTYGLDLDTLGLVLAAVTLGLVATLILWGMLADRFGERWVMSAGLVLAAVAMLGAARADTLTVLLVWLVLAGAAGGSVNAASGRAVLGWFGPAERGFAMGVRQTALPLGAGLAAAVLPRLAGLDVAFTVLAAGCLVAAVAVALWVREAPSQQPGRTQGPSPLRDPRIRRLWIVSLLLVVPQFTVVAFLVVYLHDEHHVSVASAALLLTLVQFGGAAGRLVAGHVADRLGLRLGPLRWLALTITGLFALLAVLEESFAPAVVPVVLVAGIVAISWNGLVFTAVGELAGPGKAGAALGLQNTAVAAGAVLTPPLLGRTVELSNWGVAYGVAALAGLAAYLLLAPLVATEPRLRHASPGPPLPASPV